MAKWEFVDWLMFWILDTTFFEFEWDTGNKTKNLTKHKISIEEVESVFRSGLALPLGVQIHPIVNEQRLGLVGPALDGKYLQIAFTMRNKKVRVISARPAHKKEKMRYEKILRKIKKRVCGPF